MRKVFNIAIVGAHEEEFRSLKESLASAHFETTLSITQQDKASLQHASDNTDLTIYCQEEGVSGPDHVPVFVSKTIFVTSCYEKEILNTAFKKGAVYVLYRPLHRSEVLLAIRNVLFFSKKYWETSLTDAAILAFLETSPTAGLLPSSLSRLPLNPPVIFIPMS